MIAATVRQPRITEEPTLEELLANVMRNSGWIMAGGSAQFRQNTLTELQANLRQLQKHPLGERAMRASTLLGEKAVVIATRNLYDVESIMGLNRILGEFDQAMKAQLATSAKR